MSSPSAGTVKGSGILSTRSGSPRRHFELGRGETGMVSPASPRGAPSSDHDARRAIWWSLRRRASRKLPNPGAARHGGISRSPVMNVAIRCQRFAFS